MQVAVQQLSSEGWFKWLVAPGPDCDELFTWYIDGSLHEGAWVEYRAVGFGIVVVAPDRSLAAYGLGVPPCWCRTAAAAEAWALHVALKETAFPPKLRTDCQCLLTTAREGAMQATGPARPLARIWGLIATSLDGQIESIVERGNLVWMPAHQPLSAISVAMLSNGKLLSGVDWRANRLVDALAKSAAETVRAPRAVRCLLESGRIAVRHRAALLAVVTNAANNFKEPTQRPDGSWGTQTLRDAQQPPGHVRRQRKQPKPPAEPAPLPAHVGSGLPDGADGHVARPTKRQRTASTTRQRKRRAFGGLDGRPSMRQRARPSLARRCQGEARANVLGPVAALPSVLLGPLSSPVTSGFLQHRAGHQEVRECRLPDGHRADSCAGQRADASVACDPIEELESLSRCGLKVSWPRQKASASAKAASSGCVGTRAASSGDPGAAQVLSRGGSGCAPAASSDGSCDGPPSCSCLPSCAADESLAAALEDLKALDACGCPVTWPR